MRRPDVPGRSIVAALLVVALPTVLGVWQACKDSTGTSGIQYEFSAQILVNGLVVSDSGVPATTTLTPFDVGRTDLYYLDIDARFLPYRILPHGYLSLDSVSRHWGADLTWMDVYYGANWLWGCYLEPSGSPGTQYCWNGTGTPPSAYSGYAIQEVDRSHVKGAFSFRLSDNSFEIRNGAFNVRLPQ